MLTWYHSKVKYSTMVEGAIKTITEEYLHQGVNYGDAETQHFTTLKTRMKDIDVDGLNKARFNEVVFYKGTDDEYRVDPFFSLLVVTGDEKGRYLIPAKDAQEAIQRAIKAHGYGEPKDVKEIKEMKLLGVWHPHNELWQGDWWNRMERLLDAKKCSWNLNQTEINFDGDNNDDDDEEQPQSDQNAITAIVKATPLDMLIRSGVESVDAEDLDNGTSEESPSETLSPVLALPEGNPEPPTDEAFPDDLPENPTPKPDTNIEPEDDGRPKKKKGKGPKGENITFQNKKGEPVS